MKSLIVALGLMATAVSAKASDVAAVVVYTQRGCDYFIAENQMGYLLLEWYGGWTPDKRDIIVGDIHRYGFTDVKNIGLGTSTRVWVDDYMLSQSSVVSKFQSKCS